MSWLVGDLKYAFRSMAKHRAFTAVAVLSLALGIGANTTIFSLLNGILLRSLPVADPDRLLAVHSIDPKSAQTLRVSYPNYLDFRNRNTVFSNLALYTAVTVNLTGIGEPRPLISHLVSGNYFQTLGVSPLIGRGFLPEEDVTPNARAVTVISYSLWQKLFAFDPQVTGHSLTLSGRAFRIVGVAPQEFRGTNELYGADLWIPMAMYPQVFPAPAWVNQRRAAVFSVVGRLKAGVSQARAQGQMQTIAGELAREFPRDNGGRGIVLSSVAEAAISAQDRLVYSRTASILLIISGIVLLIACANVANLLMARAAARTKEISVRLAMGATRWHLVRQLLVESILLSCLGGAVGLIAAQFAHGLLWPLRPPMMKYAAFRFDLDARVLAYAFGSALLTGILFGLPPAFGASRSDLATDLKERTGSAPTAGRFPSRAALVMLQLAFSLVALIGAGLFLRSLQAAMQIDPGFDAQHTGFITFNVTDQGYNEARGREYRRSALERAAAVPGVEAVSLSKDAPFSVGGTRTVLLHGREDLTNGAGHPTLTSVTYPGYFQTLRIPRLKGRDFTLADSTNSPRVAIVNDTAARMFWPDEEAVGKVIQFAGENLPVEIIGVVRNAAYLMPGEAPQAMVYLSAQQYYFAYSALYIRAARDVAATLAAVRAQLHTLDPNLYLDPQTVDDAMRQTLWAQSLSAGLLTLFGVLALLLSSLGIYGVMSYVVSLRAREIGVRMALGADAGRVQRMLLREGAQVVLVGLGGGMLAAFALSHALQSMLVGVGSRDPGAFMGAAVVLSIVAMGACWLPARRATRIDPSLALRSE